MEGIPVTLIVKAPNQQIEDQTIHCELSWTISKLKGYLAEVYPNKPTSEEQKLIYSGQLLNDNIVLKDVLRRYDGENTNTHTMHLVCLPKRYKQTTEAQKATKSQDGDGVRRRNAPAAENPAGCSQQQQATSSAQARVTDTSTERPAATDASNWSAWNANWMQYMSQQNPQAVNYGYAPFADPSAPNQWNQNPGFTYQQQINTGIPINNQYAWMQYMYNQYMHQYYQFIVQGTFPQAPYLYQYTPVEQQQQQNTFEAQAEPAVGGGEAGDAVDAAAAPLQAEDAAPVPDILDRMYVILRWVVLILIVYFYSSPVRFVLVLSLGIIIYIYQSGFFRPIPARIPMPHERLNQERARQQQAGNAENQNAEPERPNPNPEGQNAIGEAPNLNEANQDAGRQNADAELRPDAQINAEQDQRENANADQNTLLTITWTIFTSFFTSLIPDAPNAL